MSTFVIDAYAWVEYFAGTELGAKVCGIVEDEENTIITNAVTVAELASKFGRDSKAFEPAKRLLISLSRIEVVDGAAAAEVGTLHADLRKTRKHMGLADAFVVFTARKHHAKILTGDQDFKGLKEAVFL